MVPYPDLKLLHRFGSIHNFARAGHGEIQRYKIFMDLELVEGSRYAVQDLNVEINFFS